MGIVNLNCEFKGNKKTLQFHILNSKFSQSILSLLGAISLKILSDKKDLQIDGIDLSVSNILTMFNKVFLGIGKVNTECKIVLSDEVLPKISAARKIPIDIRENVKNKLIEMESQNIIEKIDTPTDWVHPIVTVAKPNGDVRICMDPRKLNEYIKREHFQIPDFEDLFSKLANSKVYSLLDASSAFLQVPLDKQSSDLCTIATPFGRYKYLRMPFGISNAPEVFQRIITNILDGLSGVIAYFDDILVFGSDINEHNNNLKKVLQRISDSGLTLNKDKSKFAMTEVKFLGHVINSSGIKVDDSKVKAITNISTPKNKTELQRFLGMITYLGKFLPNLSQKTYPLRKLLCNKNVWLWDTEQETCFNYLKDLVTTTPVLSYFNPCKDIVLSVDSSQYGMGAVLL